MSDAYNQITGLDLAMPDDFIKAEVISQITCTNTPIYGMRKNMLELFNRKLEYIKNNYSTEENDEETDIEDLITDELHSFYSSIISQLREVWGIFIDTSSGEPNEANVNFVYGMFILRLHDNIVEYLTQYIINNKNQITERFDDDQSSNLSVRMARKQYKNKVDATLAIHIYEIIDSLLEDENVCNPETILKTLYRYNPEDYTYVMAYNMLTITYISFDIPKYQEHLRLIYTEPATSANLKIAVLERLLPTFKEKEQSND